jgi:hypothetical protein
MDPSHGVDDPKTEKSIVSLRNETRFLGHPTGMIDAIPSKLFSLLKPCIIVS